MDVLTLRAQIEAVLSSYLGTYTLSNGETTPAVSVRDPGQGQTPGTKVNGLEVVILSQPEMVPVREYQNDNAIRVWSVYLVGWGSSVDLQESSAALMANFPGSEVATLSVPEDVGPRNQMRVTIRTNADPIPAYGPVVNVDPFVDRPISVTVPSPQAGDEFTLTYTQDSLTLTQVLALVQGSSTPSVTFVLRYDADRSATGTLATQSLAVTNTTTGQLATIQNMPIPANRFVWLELTAVSGTVTEFTMTAET